MDDDVYAIKEFKRSVEDESQWVAVLDGRFHGVPITDKQKHTLEKNDHVRLVNEQTIEKVPRQ